MVATGQRSTGSEELLRALASVWLSIQQRHPELPDIELTVGPARGRLGLCAPGTWRAGTGGAGTEPAGQLHVDPLTADADEVLARLLHAAAHGLAAVRGIRETSREDRYHNTAFRTVADEVGLGVERDRVAGWAKTTPTASTARAYEGVVARLRPAIRRYQGAVAAPARRSASGNRRLAMCRCDQPRRIRASARTLAQGPILCGVCEEPFVERAAKA